jgi:hypothetical protein
MRIREADWSWPGSVTGTFNISDEPKAEIGECDPATDLGAYPPEYSGRPRHIHNPPIGESPVKIAPRTVMAVAVAVVALVLSAGAGATASLLITGKQIKDSSVTSKDIKNKSLKVKDLSTKAQAKLKGRTGATGERGATGPAGPAGPAGASGLPGLPGIPGLSGFDVVKTGVVVPGLPGSNTGTVVSSCPAGKKALSANGGFLEAPLSSLGSLLSQVTRTSDGSFEATGVNLLGALTSEDLILEVVCATVPN